MKRLLIPHFIFSTTLTVILCGITARMGNGILNIRLEKQFDKFYLSITDQNLMPFPHGLDLVITPTQLTAIAVVTFLIFIVTFALGLVAIATTEN
jgi:hypothetical protein